MASLVYFKFKANVKTDSIPFDGSSISVKDLKNSIRTKCCLYSTDFDLKLEDSSGREFQRDEELIPKYTSIVVRRAPRINNDCHKKKQNAYDDLNRREIFSNTLFVDSTGFTGANLAETDLTEDEKIRIMMERSSEIYSDKNIIVKAKPYGIPPPGYVCHKCNLSGHWIHNCPGIRDQSGRLMDSKSIKRPTGIPQDFLLEVEAGTPGAYLGKTGRYMVPIKDAEAYALGKKEKRPFSIEENPPYVPPKERKPPKHFICPLCSKLLHKAVLVACCGTTYCNNCILGNVFDSEVLGSHKCPNCGVFLHDHESTVFENAIVRSLICEWLGSENSIVENQATEISQPVASIIGPDNVVRRVLKPKHSSSTEQLKTALKGTQNELLSANLETPLDKSPLDLVKKHDGQHLGISPCSNTLTMPLTSSSFYLDDVKYSTHASSPHLVVSNTCNNVASMPCATLVGVSCSDMMLDTPPVTASFPFCSGGPLMMPGIVGGENSAFINAIYGGNLAGFQQVGTRHSVHPLAGVYQGVPLVSAGTLWPGSDLQYLGTGVTHGSYVNHNDICATNLMTPLIYGINENAGEGVIQDSTFPIDNLLSKEEFYRHKMKIMQQSRRRAHRSRSRDAHSRSHHGIRRKDRYKRRQDERYTRHRGDRHKYYRSTSRERSDLRSRSRPSNRNRSRSGSARVVEDYDTWRHRKERRNVENSFSHSLRSRPYDISNISPGSKINPQECSRPRYLHHQNDLEAGPSGTHNGSPVINQKEHNSSISDHLNTLPDHLTQFSARSDLAPLAEPQNRLPEVSIVPQYTVSDTGSSRGNSPRKLYRLPSPINIDEKRISIESCLDTKHPPAIPTSHSSENLVYCASSRSPFAEYVGEIVNSSDRKNKKKKEKKRKHKHSRENKRSKKSTSLNLPTDNLNDYVCLTSDTIGIGTDIIKKKHKKHKHKKNRDLDIIKVKKTKKVSLSNDSFIPS